MIWSPIFAALHLRYLSAACGVEPRRTPPLVHEWHPVVQHTVDQTGQLGRHSLNRNRSPEFGSEPAKLRS